MQSRETDSANYFSSTIREAVLAKSMVRAREHRSRYVSMTSSSSRMPIATFGNGAPESGLPFCSYGSSLHVDPIKIGNDRQTGKLTAADCPNAV